MAVQSSIVIFAGAVTAVACAFGSVVARQWALGPLSAKENDVVEQIEAGHRILGWVIVIVPAIAVVLSVWLLKFHWSGARFVLFVLPVGLLMRWVLLKRSLFGAGLSQEAVSRIGLSHQLVVLGLCALGFGIAFSQ